MSTGFDPVGVKEGTPTTLTLVVLPYQHKSPTRRRVVSRSFVSSSQDQSFRFLSSLCPSLRLPYGHSSSFRVKGGEGLRDAARTRTQDPVVGVEESDRCNVPLMKLSNPYEVQVQKGPRSKGNVLSR